MKEVSTNDGRKGGWLKGKPHYDKNGKPLGGIKAIVTDSGKPVELEGGEVIINKEASAKHWKELSRINQSAGGGVAIGPPGSSHDEDPEEYAGGGKIEFNPNHIPNKWILQYAENIKKNHPEIWKLGGNIFGNEAFVNLQRVAKRGYWIDSEEWMYIKWRSYVARHAKDFRIEGVVAMLKWVDKVDKGWPYMKQLIEEKIAKLKSKKQGWKHKMKTGGEVSQADIEKRWDKKINAVGELANNIQSLRYNLTKDLKSDNEKEFLTALVISIIDNTGERVGNEDSADNGHFGVTGFQKKHIKVNGNTITLKYVGKSGVDHETTFTSEVVATALKKAIKNSPSNFVFTTSDGFQIKADKINRYLSQFNVSAKDLRGYSANKWIVDKLKNVTIEKEEIKRKKQFNEIVARVAEKIGHGKATLKTHYLLPELETNFVENGNIINIKEMGGVMRTGGIVTYKQKFNKKYGYDKNEAHDLEEISKESGVSKKGLQEIYNKGVGAYKTNPESVRPNVKSKEQWGMARVYSAVMGGKAAKVDAKELKMKTGGELEKGIKTEQEHKKTLQKIASGKLTVDQAIERTAKDHLKEDPKYYTKLSKMESKMATGGTVNVGNETVSIGDEVILKGRGGNKNIKITNITDKWVIFTDLSDGKRKDTPVDSFIKNYGGKASSTSKPNPTQDSIKEGQFYSARSGKAYEIVKKDKNGELGAFNISDNEFFTQAKQDDIQYYVNSTSWELRKSPKYKLDEFVSVDLNKHKVESIEYNNGWIYKLSGLSGFYRELSLDKVIDKPQPKKEFALKKTHELKQEAKIAQNSENSLESWISNNMQNTINLDSKLLTKKILSDFAVTMKLLSEKDSEKVLQIVNNI